MLFATGIGLYLTTGFEEIYFLLVSKPFFFEFHSFLCSSTLKAQRIAFRDRLGQEPARACRCGCRV